MSWADSTARVLVSSTPLQLTAAAFAAGFVVRLERWYRITARVAEAVRSRVAGGEP